MEKVLGIEVNLNEATKAADIWTENTGKKAYVIQFKGLSDYVMIPAYILRKEAVVNNGGKIVHETKND